MIRAASKAASAAAWAAVLAAATAAPVATAVARINEKACLSCSFSASVFFGLTSSFGGRDGTGTTVIGDTPPDFHSASS